MKTKVLFFLGFILFSGFIQGQTKVIQGKKFEKVDGKWYQIENNNKYKVIENTIIVKFKNGVSEKSINDFMKSNDLTLNSKNDLGYYDFKIKDSDFSLDVVEKLQSNILVEVIENDAFFEFSGIPDDPLYMNQWHLQDEIDQDGVYKFGIDAYKAWDKTTGSSNVILAILDSGAAFDATDLNGNIYVNPGEDLDHDGVVWDGDDINGQDDDGNGKVDDLIGWDFENNDPDTRGLIKHGTIVAGIAGAKNNNNWEYAGVAGGWVTPSTGCKMLICQVGDYGANGINLANAIIYAANQGATAITMSIGGPELSVVTSAINYAYKKGCFIDCASGNDGQGNIIFPATNCFSVGASTLTGYRWPNSSYGTGLMVVAPGVDIFATGSNTYPYTPGDGTSFSAPQVAATACLIKSLYPFFTNYDIEEAICLTAQKLKPEVYDFSTQLDYGGWNNEVGYGKLNADRALGVTGINGNMALREYNYIAKEITMAAGSVLELKENSTLYIRSGSKVNIYGGQITVKNGAQLILDGEFLIKHNAALTINCQGGDIFLNGTINAETASSLSFTGSGPATKMLEVDGVLTFPSNLSSVSFSNGKIVMNNSSSKMQFNYPTSSVSFNNIKVTSASGSYQANPGFTLYNIQNVSVQNSTFEYGYYGLYLMTTNTYNRPIIYNCTFQHCYYGLLAYNSGVTISYSRFKNNTNMGIYCLSMDRTSSFSHVTCSSNTNYGLYYEGASTSSYSLQYSSASLNKYGIFTKGPLTADMACSSSFSNTNYGIEAYNNASLDIGSSYLYGNKVAIQGAGSSYGNYDNNFTLNDGYNDLRDNGTTDSWCIYGRFWAFGTSPLTVAANNNYWKSGGGAPVNNTDYKVYAEYDFSLTITDNSPEYYYQLCWQPGGASIPENSSISSFGLTDLGEYQEVTTSLGTEPLNVTVETILNEDTKSGTVYDDPDRFELLAELLDNTFDHPNANEKWFINHAYTQFKTLTGKLTFTKKNTDKALKVVRKIKKDRMKYNNKKVDFSGLIDEALLLDYSGEFEEAISVLQANQSLLDSDDAAYFDELICKIGVDQLVDAGGYEGNIAEAYNQCTSTDETRKSGSVNNDNESNTPNSSINSEIELSIMPNPVTGTSVINGFIPEQYGQAELTIINSNGATVFTESLQPGTVTKTISIPEWAEGVYLVIIRANGEIVANQKMVIIK